jgi:predicted RNA methylase
MKPHMTENELMLFLSFVRNSENYLEFGCGGSTNIAASYVTKRVISIDSSEKWIETVKEDCRSTKIEVEFVYKDIGPVGDWGMPIGEPKKKWEDYHNAIWYIENSRDTDLFFIDGRFRVACFAQIILHSKRNTIIGIHDFNSRQKHYGAINEIGREIACTGDLSFFLSRWKHPEKTVQILEEYKQNWR